MKELGPTHSGATKCWRAIRRLGVSVGVAVAVVVVGSRVNPADPGGAADVRVEDVLLRPVKDAEIDLRSLRRAADSLGRAAGVRITVDEAWPDVEYAAPRGGGAQRVRVTGRPLGWALGRVLWEFDTVAQEQLSYEVVGDGIRVGADARMSDPVEVRAYDVREFLVPRPRVDRGTVCFGYDGAADRDARQEAADRMVMGVMALVSPTKWAMNGGGGGVNVWTMGTSLVVTAPAQLHRDVARLLFLLRHPATPGRIADAEVRR